MTPNDISGHFAVIRELADKVAGADLPAAEQQVVKTLFESGLRLLESVLLDLNRSADSFESIANTLQNWYDR